MLKPMSRKGQFRIIRLKGTIIYSMLLKNIYKSKIRSNNISNSSNSGNIRLRLSSRFRRRRR